MGTMKKEISIDGRLFRITFGYSEILIFEADDGKIHLKFGDEMYVVEDETPYENVVHDILQNMLEENINFECVHKKEDE